MECPKCGFEQPGGSDECVACGVIFERYERAQTEGGYTRVPTLEQQFPEAFTGHTTYAGGLPERGGLTRATMSGSSAIDLLERPTILTLFGWLFLISSFLGVIAGIVMWDSEIPLYTNVFIGAGLSFLAAIGIFVMARWTWYLLVLMAVVMLIVIPIGTILGGVFLAYLLQRGTRVLFSGKVPHELSPVEREAAEKLRGSHWNAGLTALFVATLIVVPVIAASKLKPLLDYRSQQKTFDAMQPAAEMLSYYYSRVGRLPGSGLDSAERALRQQDALFRFQRDGWGNDFEYRRIGGHYYLISPGKDGVFEDKRLYSEEVTKSFDCDIVLSSRGWVRYADPLDLDSLATEVDGGS